MRTGTRKKKLANWQLVVKEELGGEMPIEDFD